MKSVEYYTKKFGSDKQKAFIHLAKEVGELAGSIEKGNEATAQYELAEIVGICHFLASAYGVADLNARVEEIYATKLAKLDAQH